jgi:hypothetical protein
MITRGFIDVEVNKCSDQWWFHNLISDLKETLQSIENFVIDEHVCCSKALAIMKEKSIDCLIQFKDGYNPKRFFAI